MFTVTWLEKWVSRLELYLFVFVFFFNTNEYIWLSCFSSIQLEFLEGKDTFKKKKEKKKFTIGGGEAEEL